MVTFFGLPIPSKIILLKNGTSTKANKELEKQNWGPEIFAIKQFSSRPKQEISYWPYRWYSIKKTKSGKKTSFDVFYQNSF